MITLKCDRCGSEEASLLRFTPKPVVIDDSIEVTKWRCVPKDLCVECSRDFTKFMGEVYEQRRADDPKWDRT